MNARFGILIFFILSLPFATGATIFTNLPNDEGVSSRVEIDQGFAKVVISTPSGFAAPSIEFESLLGYSSDLLVFQITNAPLVTLPSPPFSIGGIDFPATSSRLVFEQEFSLTEMQEDLFSRLDSTLLRFSGAYASEVFLLTASSVPEPGFFMLITLASVTALCLRRRTVMRYQA